ncbi:MAG: hypothetical protein HYZ63_02190 [Candidatus Andersenbacteria bacterium]|nr:hypothetical protein [Candidatus Andersenbacteria bacterium]
MIASVRFINRQYRATVNTEGEAAAARIADDGLEYVVFLLGSGTKTVTALVNGAQPVTQTVVDSLSGASSGTFALTLEADEGAPTEALTITSIGTSSLGGSQCYTVIADISRVTGTTIYQLTSWKGHSGC